MGMEGMLRSLDVVAKIAAALGEGSEEELRAIAYGSEPRKHAKLKKAFEILRSAMQFKRVEHVVTRQRIAYFNPEAVDAFIQGWVLAPDRFGKDGKRRRGPRPKGATVNSGDQIAAEWERKRMKLSAKQAMRERRKSDRK
jgi:hypothetical protein